MDYTAKVPTIVNHTFTTTDWELIQLKNTSIRKWYMKARENDNIDTKFDYDFTATHSTYATNGGQGLAFDGVALPDVYARVANTAIVLELVYFG